MENTCFTIGHSNHTQEAFLGLLRRHRIRWVVDIRSVPYSKYVPHFNKPDFERFLREDSIKYIYLGGILGGKSFFRPSPDTAGENPRIKAGIDRLVEIIRREEVAVIVCAEYDPARCHRGKYIAGLLKDRGIGVAHILRSGEISTSL